MKRYLIGFSLLLCFAAGLLVWTSVSVNSRRDQVEVRETVIYGDRSAARGLTVGFRSASFSGQRLRWNTVFTLGEGELRPETEFAYVKKWNYAWDWSWRAQMLPASWNFSGSNWLFDSPNQRLMNMLLPAQGVAARTQVGETRTEVVSLADYYQYFPLTLSASWRYHSYFMDEGDAVLLGRIFRLPVLPEYYVQVSVTRWGENEADRFYRSAETGAYAEPVIVPASADHTAEAPYVEGSWSDGWTLSMPAVPAENGVYVYPSCRTEDGEELFEYPDGPGVYFIPMGLEQGAAEPGWLALRRTRLFYPTNGQPLDMYLSEDGGSLLLYTRENERLVLTCLDSVTGEARQVLDLLDMTDTDLLVTKVLDGLYLAVLENGDLALVEERDGQCRALLTSRIDLDLEVRLGSRDLGLRHLIFENTAMAWDGQRLALADCYSELVAVIDSTGLRFLAQYDYSPRWDGRGSYNIYEKLPMTVWFE